MTLRTLIFSLLGVLLITSSISNLSFSPLETEEESRSLEKAFLFHLFLDSSFLFLKKVRDEVRPG
jgi:hypothetical protein